MLSLENLKKQAKRYQRWHRQGRHVVAAQIRADLPRFAQLSDAEIMAMPFKLAHAQEIVARQSGFATWRALKESLTEMTNAQKPAAYPAQPIITSAEPQVFVTDMPRALAFYTGKLGFKVGFTYGEPAFYAQVVRDGAMINLRHVDQPALDHSAGEALLSAAMSVSNAKLLFQEFESRGVAFRQTLTREPWHAPGHGNFCVADPDGNLLLFGGRTD